MKIEAIFLVVVSLLCIQISIVGASEIIVKDADTIWNITTAYSENLTNVTHNVTPRILAEYANSIYRNDLNPSTDLLNVTSNVTPRILAEYANSIYRNDFNEIPIGLANLTKEVLPKIIIEYANSNYYNELIFPKELINDIAPPNITDVTVANLTGNSAAIKWNTDEIADSSVKYGKASGVYTESVSDLLFVKNHSIELTGLLSKTSYYFVVSSKDRSENSNESSEHTFTTAIDTAPPASITNLKNISFAKNYINWTWTDPSDNDFSKVMVYLDGIFQTNVSKGVQYYNAAGLKADTEHTVGTHTIDTSGNINHTWVNHTARTASRTTIGGTTISIASQTVAPDGNVTVPIIASNVTDLSAFSITLSYNPAVVWVDKVTAGDFGTPVSNINNATGSTTMSGVSITGKSGNLVLANVVLKAVGTAGQTSPLTLTVTTLSDNNGNNIPATVNNGTFTISAKGDVNGDGKVDITDALFIAQYTVGLRTLTPTQLAAGDVNCDGKVDITDALFIAQYTVGLRTTFC